MLFVCTDAPGENSSLIESLSVCKAEKYKIQTVDNISVAQDMQVSHHSLVGLPVGGDSKFKDQIQKLTSKFNI